MKWTANYMRMLHLHHRCHNMISAFVLYQQWFWQSVFERQTWWFIGKKLVDSYEVIKFFKEFMNR